MQKCVIGFIGSQLDGVTSHKRWEKWRPTVSLGQHEDLHIDCFELFFDAKHQLIADAVKTDLAEVSPRSQVNLHCAAIANPWDFEEVYSWLYDWLQRYTFAPDSVDYLAHITTGTHVAQICLYLLVESRALPGVLLQSAPPRGRSQVGQPSYELIDLDLSRYNKIAQRLSTAKQDGQTLLKGGIATRNARFNKLISEIEFVAARSNAPLLLSGPTGAGKSMLAKRIYELRHARHLVVGRFVDVNCAHLRGDAAASALFGHAKGAYTGATADRQGFLRAADKGILFLDEIGELGTDEQAMLLKAIEEKVFFPVGSDREVKSDFQLIAGSNRDLRVDVAQGRFRADLFARINQWVYALPSLKERPEDIEPNIEFLLQQFALAQNAQVRFNTEAKKKYLQFAQSGEALWLGNFRDLSASVGRLAVLASAGRVDTDLVAAEIERLRWLWRQDNGQGQADDEVWSSSQTAVLRRFLGDPADKLDLFDQMQLVAVIRQCLESKSLSEAGRKLFAVSRVQRGVINDADRLRKYLAKFGLSWEQLQSQSAS
jgi:transcriptional regulatory protein RtcR